MTLKKIQSWKSTRTGVSINLHKEQPHSYSIYIMEEAQITALCKLMNVGVGPWQLALGEGWRECFSSLAVHPQSRPPPLCSARLPVCHFGSHSPSGPPVEAQLCSGAGDRLAGEFQYYSLPMVMESLRLSGVDS